MTASTQMKVLSKIDPELAKRVENYSRPVLNNVENIPMIYNEFSRILDMESDPLMKKLKFVSVILRLYSPASLLTEVRTKTGVCSKIAIALGYGDVSNISHMIARARAYMSVQSFKTDVENIAGWIKGKGEA